MHKWLQCDAVVFFVLLGSAAGWGALLGFFFMGV